MFIERTIKSLVQQRLKSYPASGSDWVTSVRQNHAGTPFINDFDGLNRPADLIGADKCGLVSQTTHSTIGENRISCSLPELLEIFAKSSPL
ncbi:MAG: hypothetical protein CV087_18560 [Candidatus Brocadia sp. WS118]|nr:MAG: hypothetical protein CV087_18560 [Candidatus Brocadia sp. WS118]